MEDTMIQRVKGAILGIALLAGIGSAADGQQVLINGAGATFPYPMYSKWFDEYHKKVPTIAFNYGSIGSGGGIQQVTAGTVDFGASDAPMNDQAIKDFRDKRGMGVLHFPTVAGADVPVYNIPRDGSTQFHAGSACRDFPGENHKMERSGNRQC